MPSSIFLTFNFLRRNRFLILTFCIFISIIKFYTDKGALKIPNEVIPRNPDRMFNISEFKYLISKSECSSNQNKASVPLFITLVHSAPSHYSKRAACRDTWAHSDSRTRTYFLMGMVKFPLLQKRINDEEEKFHDIIQGNFVDSYGNMTYKHTMALKWFSENCPRVKYLLKLDDDVFVNIPAVHELLMYNTKHTDHLLGEIFKRSVVFRHGKWKVTREQFSDDFYPEYLSGPSIIYSNYFVHEALKETRTTPFFWIDDVYIGGIIREKLKIKATSIQPLILSGDILEEILIGFRTTLPEPMFIVSEHSRNYDDMIKLWVFIEPYRRQHQYERSLAVNSTQCCNRLSLFMSAYITIHFYQMFLNV